MVMSTQNICYGHTFGHAQADSNKHICDINPDCTWVHACVDVLVLGFGRCSKPVALSHPRAKVGQKHYEKHLDTTTRKMFSRSSEAEDIERWRDGKCAIF